MVSDSEAVVMSDEDETAMERGAAIETNDWQLILQNGIV